MVDLQGMAFDISASGNDLYITGTDVSTSPSHYWKNNKEVFLPKVNKNDTINNSHYSATSDISVVDNDVYVTAQDESNFRFCKNNDCVNLNIIPSDIFVKP